VLVRSRGLLALLRCYFCQYEQVAGVVNLRDLTTTPVLVALRARSDTRTDGRCIERVKGMDGTWERVVDNLVSRLTGPMHLRLLLQPAMALFFGIRDGLKDTREDKPAYFWAVFTTPGYRVELLKSGLRSVAKVLIAAIILDTIYQIIALRWFYPGEAILVAFILAFVPYLLIRGPANRIAKWWTTRRSLQNQRGASG
jgi:hypothetical protein